MNFFCLRLINVTNFTDLIVNIAALLSTAVGLFIAAYVVCVPNSEQSIFSTGKRASSKVSDPLFSPCLIIFHVLT